MAPLPAPERHAPPSGSPPPDRAPFAEVTVGPNQVALLKDGYQAYPAMLEAIAAATSTICLESYIFEDDTAGRRFLDALEAKARAGVEVLLMYDAWGSVLSTETVARLQQAGVKTRAFGRLHFTDQLNRLFSKLLRRNHRKSLVVDGRVAFTGGLNISNDYAAVEDGGRGWRDTHVRIVGPQAQELEQLFLDTWRRGLARRPKPSARFDRPPVPPLRRLRFLGNDFARNRKHVRGAYTEAINRSASRVLLTHAYFVPPAKLLRSLTRAAHRGVRVAIIVAAATDVRVVLWAARGLYGRLLRAGVEVYEWHGLPGPGPQRVLHAKTAVVDGVWATVGSSNLDPLSLRQNLEVNAIIEDETFADALERMFAEDLRACTQVTLETVRSWGWLTRLASWVAFRIRRFL